MADAVAEFDQLFGLNGAEPKPKGGSPDAVAEFDSLFGIQAKPKTVAKPEPVPEINLGDLTGTSRVATAPPPAPPSPVKPESIVPPATATPPGMATPAQMSEALKPRTDTEAAESILGSLEAPPLSMEAAERQNAPEPLPRDIRGSVAAPPRGVLPKQPVTAAKQGLKNTISGLIGGAVAGGTHQTAEEQRYDPAILDTAIEQSVALGADPLTLATFAIGSAPGAFAARQAAGLLAKRLGPEVALRAIQGAQAVAGGGTSFALYDAATEALRQGARREFEPREIAKAGKHGFVMGAAMGAGGAATMAAPHVLQVATEIGILASAPAVMEGRAPTVDDVIDAGVLVGGLKGAGRIRDFAKRALSKPAAQRTPVEAQIVRNLPVEVKQEIVEDALKTAAEKATERAKELGTAEPEKPTEPISGTEEPHAGPMPTALEAGMERRGVEPVEKPDLAQIAKAAKTMAEAEPEAEPEAPAPEGPLQTAAEKVGAPAKPVETREEQVRRERAQMAEAANEAQRQARRKLYQSVPATFGEFVQSQGRRWPISITEPGYMAMRTQYDDMKKPVYGVQGPRLGQWQIVSRLTGEVEATAPSRPMAQLEANRLDAARMKPASITKPVISASGVENKPEIKPEPAETLATSAAPPEQLFTPDKRARAEREARERAQMDQAVAESEAPPEMVTLYRGEGTTNVALPEWAKSSAGQWFTSNRNKAERYAAERGGQVREVQIPKAEVEQYRGPSGTAPDEYMLPQIVQQNRGARVVPPAQPQVPVTPVAARSARPAPAPKVPRGTPRQLATRADLPVQTAPTVENIRAEMTGFDPSDIEQLARFVRGKGGIAPSPTGDLKGEYSAVPLRFKNRRGLTPDRMAEAVSEEAGRPVEDWQILQMLAQGKILKEHQAERAKVEEQAPARADELAEMADLPDDVKARRIAAMMGIPEAEAFRMVERQKEAPAAKPAVAAERDADEFQRAAQDYFGVSPDEPAAAEVLNQPHFGRFGGADRVIQDIFHGDRGQAESALAAAKQDVLEGRVRVDEERAPYGVEEERAPYRGKSGLLYSKGDYYVTRGPKGFEVYRNEGSAAVKVATIGDGPGPNLGMARAIAEADKRAGVESPPPPRYEPTPEGEQGLIEGASARAIPTNKTRPAARQRPVEETPLFKKEEKETQFGLPGVEEQRAPYRGRVETPEFRRWFGASKVTDEDGSPKVLYHGTGQPGFEAIDPTKLDPNALYGRGFYMTESPDVAGGKVDMREVQKVFDTREEAERAPGRSYFVWQEGDKFKITVKEPRFAHRGYAHKDRSILEPADRRAVMDEYRRSDEYRHHVAEPGYLSSTEREFAQKRLDEWERSGATYALSMLEEQPYNMHGLRTLVDARTGAGGVYPVYAKIEKPFNIEGQLTSAEAERLFAAAKEAVPSRAREIDASFDTQFGQPEMRQKLQDLEAERRQIASRAGFGSVAEQNAATERREQARRDLNLMKPNGPQWERAVAEARSADAAMAEFVPGWGKAIEGPEAERYNALSDQIAKMTEIMSRRSLPAENIYDILRAHVASGRERNVPVPEQLSINTILQRAGYDGLTHMGGNRTGGEPHRVWIAFEPTQVKSATGNRGTFDPRDASMVREEPAPYENQPTGLNDASRQGAARFIGYQEGGREPFPLYNVTQDGGEFTYGADTLREKGIAVPETPSFQDWQRSRSGVSSPEISREDAMEPRAAYAPTFYSGLSKLVEDKMPAAAPAAMVRNIIKQAKPDEVKWTGLDDFLAQRGGAKVTKDEVRDFLKQNEVKVEEKVHGGPNQETERLKAASKESWDRLHNALERLPGEIDSDELREAIIEAVHGRDHIKQIRERVDQARREVGSSLVDEAIADAKALHAAQREDQSQRETKFSRYTLPGGREGSYRELLLTLPVAESPKLRQLRQELEDIVSMPAAQTTYKGEPRTAAYDRVYKEFREAGGTPGEPRYKSPHWDEPNVLAHIRFNDRTDAEGKKVLFLEEIQSDWHQEGRRKGYAGDPIRQLPEGIHVIESNGRWTVVNREGVPLLNRASRETREAATQMALDHFNQMVPNRSLPAAPFAKTWHELAMKRVLRWAAEHDYDRVAWAPGSVQNERYDLSKQVKKVEYNPKEQALTAYDLNGNYAINRRGVPPEKLPDYIGKDVADRLLAAPLRVRAEGGYDVVHTLSGLDLKVGGEGMKGFYDRILPEFLNKYGKKWGARVGQSVIDSEALPPDRPHGVWRPAKLTVPSMDITPEMKQSVLEEGQALFEARPRYDLRPDAPRDAAERGRQLALDLEQPTGAEALTQSGNQPSGLIPRRGLDAGSGVRTLGLAIRRDLVNRGRVELRGQSVKTADDVASLAQVYRNPEYETFRMFWVDDAGTILATEGISSRMPGSSAPFVDDNPARAKWDMLQRMKRLGATGYWMIHNHPSGVPNPSPNDVTLTEMFRDHVPGFKGHVIINSKEFGTLLPGNGRQLTSERVPLEVEERLLQPSQEHPALGRSIIGPKEAAELGKTMETPEGWVTLLHRDSNGKVRAIQEMPENLFLRPEGADYIRGRQRAFGAAETVAYQPTWEQGAWQRAKDLVTDRTLLDAVSPREHVTLPNGRNPRPEIEGTAIRVEEEGAPYNEERPEFRVTDRRARPEEPAPIVRPVAGPPTPPPVRRAPTTAATPPRPPAGGSPLADIASMARTPQKAPLRERFSNLKERVIETQVNRFEPLRRLTRALEEQGASFDPGKSPLEIAEITKNRAMGQSDIFGNRMEGIAKDAKKAGLDEDLNGYLTLTQFDKRIRDLAARPESGVTPDGRRADGGYVNPRQFDKAKVDAGLAELRAKVGDQWPDLEGLAQRVWRQNRALLNAAKNVGLVSERAHEEIIGRGDDYVPIQVLDYLDEVGKAGASPRPFDVRYQDVLKRMEGTERDVRNVLASSYDKGLRAIATINRNRAARAVGDLAEVLPDVVTEVPADKFKLPGDKEVISAFYDGKRRNFAVDPEIKRAMDFLDAEQIGLIGKVLSATKAPLQAGATGANLAFAIPNVIRDTKRAAIYSKYGVKGPLDLVRFGADWIQGMLHAIKKDDLWERAAASGALFSTMQKNLTPEKFLQKAVGQRSALDKLNLLKRVIDTTSKINNVLEESTKLAMFQRGLRSGAPIEDIAYEVANYGGSPNFGRAGSMAQHLNLLWMFYNARLQGTAGNIRRLREKPVATLARLGAMSAIPMLAAWAWNQQFDGDNGMENIPDGDKQRYNIVLLPETYRSSTGEERRKYLKIPKEESEQVLGPMLTGFMDWLKGEHPPSAAAIAGDAIGALSPITFDVRGEPSVDHFIKAGASGILSSANPLVRVPIEVGTNYNAFQQGPLVPKSLAEHVRPTEQARPTTSRTIQDIAKLLDKTPGAEALGLTSPIKLQHIVTSSTGGAGQSTLDSSDFVLALAKKHLADIDSRPGTPETVPGWERAGRQVILSRFMGTGGGAQDREAEGRFYEALDAARRVRGSVNLTKKRGDTEGAETIKTSERPYAQNLKELEKLGRQLGAIYKDQIQTTYFSSEPLGKREDHLVSLAERRHNLLDRFRELEDKTEKFTK